MSEYIEREFALNVLCRENCGHNYEANKCNNCYTSNFINYLPAADVAEVKHGKWEWFEEKHGTPIDGYDYDWGWHCSNCKAELSDDYDDPDTPPKMRYCPNCGAKMMEE